MCILHVLHTSHLGLATFHVLSGSMWPEATCVGQPLLVDKCIKTALQTAFWAWTQSLEHLELIIIIPVYITDCACMWTPGREGQKEP